MIKIENKEDCVGCGACVQRCPVKCISLNIDEEGFGYAVADAERCIDCGLCEAVCPVLHPLEPRMPHRVVGCFNNDEGIVARASSGGTFEQLARKVIADKGVVFGAAFTPQWNVAHTYAETLEDCRKFSRSKYVQSKTGDSYKAAEQFLKAGRTVLFSGTPCQISGLRLFLRKSYPNLITVEVACHGVPSPKVWQDYLNKVAAGRRVTNVNFRNKRIGWENYLVVVEAEKGDGARKEIVCDPVPDNIYMMGFLRDLYLRPSCYACPAKSGSSGANITLADFWGIREVCRDFYNHEGVSLVLDYTGKFDPDNMTTKEVPYAEVVKHNPALVKSVAFPEGRIVFWKYFSREGIGAVGRVLPRFRKEGVLRKLFKRFIR